MFKELLSFATKLTITLLIAFTIHLSVLYIKQIPLFQDSIVKAYCFNGLLAIIIFAILNFLKTRKSNSLGFIFMGGSALKFAMYFISFQPEFLSDGEVQKTEFLAFFVPYAVSLTLETVVLVKILNKSA